MANVYYPTGVMVDRQTTVIGWNDGTQTMATPSGKDRFSLESGVLWCICKKFRSTSYIVSVLHVSHEYFDVDELNMLWTIATRFMDKRNILKVIEAAK